MSSNSIRRVAAALACIGLAGCAGAAEGTESTGEKPAKVEKNGSGQAQVVLTEQAAKRLDIKTVLVREDKSGQKVIPYSAVLYDPQGQAWTFTRPAELTFVRAQVTVRSISGDAALLTQGPVAGTTVVTVGAAELYGAELGVGK